MKGCSEEFVELLRRLVAIRRNFLPRIPPVIDLPTSQEEDFTRAIKLLASAEIEVFIESLVLKVAHTHEKDFCHLSAGPALQRMISQAISTAKADVRANHGVKAENVNGMFRRVGVELPDRLTSFIIELNSFARYRGEIAHTSGRVTKARHPHLEHKTIRAVLLPGLQQLDEYVEQLTARSNHRR